MYAPTASSCSPALAILLLWYMVRDREKTANIAGVFFCYVLGVFIAASPFMLRNYLAAGEIALTTSQSGSHLYVGNNLEYRGPVPFTSTSPFERGIHFTIEASRRTGKKLTAREASDFWTQEVIKAAKADPATF